MWWAAETVQRGKTVGLELATLLAGAYTRSHSSSN